MKKALTGSVPHIEETIKELRADRQFSVAYLKAALKELDDKNSRAAGLLALCDVAEAYGGLGMMAERNGDSDARRGLALRLACAVHQKSLTWTVRLVWAGQERALLRES